MNARLGNLILSGAVALAVSVSISSAANPLPPVGAPSDHDRLVALMRRTDALQNQLAYAKRTANSAALDAENALAVTDCLTGAVAITGDPDTGDTQYGDSADPQADILATISPDCLVAS